MNPRSVAAVAAAFVLGALVGGTAVAALRPPPPPPPPARPVAAAPRPAPPRPRSARPPPADLEGCRAELEGARAFVDALERERHGVPVPFPPDLPEAFTPERFEENVRAALAACPEAGLTLHHVECAEYPCVAAFTQPDGRMNHAMDTLRACAGWSGRFGDVAGQGNDAFATDAGAVEWSHVAPRPDVGSGPDPNAIARWEVRIDAMEAELQDTLGGRPFTRLEAVDRGLAFWEEAAATTPGSGADLFVADLQRQREALLADPARAAEPSE